MPILYTSVQGDGDTVVFLHGMASSGRYWDRTTASLSKTRRTVALDLLGFGKSPKPHKTYSYDSHIEAIKTTLDALSVREPFVLVGHSMGALIALRFAVTYPELVKKLVLIGCPVYATPQAARSEITGNKVVLRLAYYGITSRLLCNVWCRLLRPVSREIAPLYLSYLSPEIARDSVLHTWHSYNSSMQHIIEQQDVSTDLKRCSMPIRYVYGEEDQAAQPERINGFSKLQHVRAIELPGDHQVVLQEPTKIQTLLEQIA